MFRRKIIIKGLNCGKKLEKVMKIACEEKNIHKMREIKMPLVIPSVKLCNGQLTIFTSKMARARFSNDILYNNEIQIEKAVRASCSYPGVFSPCKWNGDSYIDGGVRENTPWREVKEMGADKVLCVCFEKQKITCKKSNIVDILDQSLQILFHELSEHELKGADYVLNIKTKEISLLNTKQIDYCFNKGYITLRRQLKKIKEKLLNNEEKEIGNREKFLIDKE